MDNSTKLFNVQSAYQRVPNAGTRTGNTNTNQRSNRAGNCLILKINLLINFYKRKYTLTAILLSKNYETLIHRIIRTSKRIK